MCGNHTSLFTVPAGSVGGPDGLKPDMIHMKAITMVPWLVLLAALGHIVNLVIHENVPNLQDLCSLGLT